MKTVLPARDLRRLRLRERCVLARAGRMIDLDAPEVERLGREASALPGSVAADQHVHDLLHLRIGRNHYLAKSENVLIPVDWRNPHDYRDFYHFTLSFFKEGEGETPLRRLTFPDDPNVTPITFHRHHVLRDVNLLRALDDDSPAGAIEDAELRALFIYYRSCKSDLQPYGAFDYENAFNHHGRDIVFECLASDLAALIGVHSPRNFPGISLIFAPPQAPPGEIYPRADRYVVSRRVGDGRALSLDRLLERVRRGLAPGSPGIDLPDQSRAWTQANPLSLRYFEGQATAPENELGDFVRTHCRGGRDLIRSDVLDRLLAARQDRKIQEYLAPRGSAGPIFTLDYGEILFPELNFPPGEEHYLRTRGRYMGELRSYLRRVSRLPVDNDYRRAGLPVLSRFSALSRDFFQEYFARLPSELYRFSEQEDRPALRPDTLVDFFEHARAVVREAIEYA